MSRRSQFETLADVLRVIREGPDGKQSITHVMYKANLSFAVARDYVRDLEEKGLLEQLGRMPGDTFLKNARRIYSLTNKGRIWLQSYQLLRGEMFPDIDAMPQMEDYGN